MCRLHVSVGLLYIRTYSCLLAESLHDGWKQLTDNETGQRHKHNCNIVHHKSHLFLLHQDVVHCKIFAHNCNIHTYCTIEAIDQSIVQHKYNISQYVSV